MLIILPQCMWIPSIWMWCTSQGWGLACATCQTWWVMALVWMCPHLIENCCAPSSPTTEPQVRGPQPQLSRGASFSLASMGVTFPLFRLPVRLSPPRGLHSCALAVSVGLRSQLQGEEAMLPWKCAWAVSLGANHGKMMRIVSLLCVIPGRLHKVCEVLLSFFFHSRPQRATSLFWVEISPSPKSEVRIKVSWDSVMKCTMVIMIILLTVNIRKENNLFLHSERIKCHETSGTVTIAWGMLVKYQHDMAWVRSIILFATC